jgi:GNAT superfamily N-acetyltransferase
MTTATVRRARRGDRDAVDAFTRDTWPDRDVADYLPRVFPEWVDADGRTRRTVVADAGDDPPTTDLVGVASGVLLSDWEAWAQGLRVAPDRRGEGHAVALTRALFAWALDRGASVMRNMVFSWNAPSLGLSRAAGFEACTEFRWATPAPDPAADPALDVTADPDAGWAFWSGCDARAHLRGLALDAAESWALSELTRDRLGAAAADGRLLTVRDGGVRALSLRNRTYERETGDGGGGGDADGDCDAAGGGGDDASDGETETWVEYAVGAWADADAAAALFDAVARDAASVGADRTRVLIPESAAWVTDAAAARAGVSDQPDFVFQADLTGASLGAE